MVWCIAEDVNHETINNQFEIIFVLVRLCNRFKLRLGTVTVCHSEE